MFFGNLKNFEVKLEAVNIYFTKRQILNEFKQDLEYTTVFQ